jgi:hypothetical protein
MPDMRVMAPDWKLIAERVSEPEPGNDWKKPGQVADAFRETLAIIVEGLAGVNGNGLGDGKGFEQAQKGNRHGTAQQMGYPREFDFRDVKRRQSGRNRSDDRDNRLAIRLGCRPTKTGGHDGGDDQCYQHVHLRQLVFVDYSPQKQCREEGTEAKTDGVEIERAALGDRFP